jgi:hypothetical protein
MPPSLTAPDNPALDRVGEAGSTPEASIESTGVERAPNALEADFFFGLSAFF